jgi:hypothetical protein
MGGEMTLAELLASKRSGTDNAPAWALSDLLSRRNEPLDAKFNPSGVGPGVSYGSLGSILMDFVPGGIGDAKSAADALKEAEAGNYGMSLLDAFGALPMVGGMGAIKAFHGSPHKFDAFDMSKIGTGEGAQAYGHGLYFAENPKIAESYAETLQRPTVGQFEASDFYKNAIEADDPDIHIAINAASKYGGDFKKASQALLDADAFEYKDAANILDGWAETNPVFDQGKHLYETSLEWPDPAREASDPLGPQHFLDWDKPLSEQHGLSDIFSDSPQSSTASGLHLGGDSYILDNSNRSVKPSGMTPWVLKSGDSLFDLTQKDVDRMLSGQTAEAAYSRLVSALGSQDKASSYLAGKGIPGIRYLDQGSRGAGDGTYNYVVFDDKIPRIMSRNGVSLRELYGR